MNNKDLPSPFRLMGDELEKKVMETFAVFRRSSLIKDLDLSLNIDYARMISRFRQYYFMIYPNDIDRVREQIADQQKEYASHMIVLQEQTKGEKVQRNVSYALIKRRESIDWELIKKTHLQTGVSIRRICTGQGINTGDYRWAVESGIIENKAVKKNVKVKFLPHENRWNLTVDGKDHSFENITIRTAMESSSEEPGVIICYGKLHIKDKDRAEIKRQ